MCFYKITIQKKLYLFINLLLIIFLLTSCVLIQTSDQNDVLRAAHEITESQNELDEQFQYLESRQFQTALESFNKFELKNKNSHWLLVHFGKGRALEGLNRWKEALEEYKYVTQSTLYDTSDVKGMSAYRSSFCYENLGEFEKALASLQEAKMYSHLLPTDIIFAEIPARESYIFSQLNDKFMAKEKIKEVDNGIKMLYPNHIDDPAWLSDLYLRIGKLTLILQSHTSYINSLQSLEYAQQFLVKSLELNYPENNEESSKLLIKLYSQLANYVWQMPLPKSGDLSVSEGQLAQKQVELSSLWLETYEKLYITPTDETKNPTLMSTQKELKQMSETMTKTLKIKSQYRPQIRRAPVKILPPKNSSPTFITNPDIN